jgi:hypothetical protein
MISKLLWGTVSSLVAVIVLAKLFHLPVAQVVLDVIYRVGTGQ